MGRPKLKRLDYLRTKVWAHKCSLIASEGGKLASQAALEKASNDFLRQHMGIHLVLNAGRWSKYLRGIKNVSGKTVDQFDHKKLWPGSKDSFYIGPEAKNIAEPKYPGAPVPLWAAIRGNKNEIFEGWRNVPRWMWSGWSPWIDEIGKNEKGEHISFGWEPERSNFRKLAPLYTFLLDYLNERTSPLVALTAAISVARIKDEHKIILFQPSGTLKPNTRPGIEKELEDISLNINEIFEAALEYGLEIYDYEEIQKLPRSKAKALLFGNPRSLMSLPWE